MASIAASRGAAPVTANGGMPTELRLQNKRKRTSDPASLPPSTRVRLPRVAGPPSKAAPKAAAGASRPAAPRQVDYRLHAGVGAAEALGSADEVEVVVRVAPKYLTLNSAPIRGRQLWGSDVYTDDSDITCMLQHTGHFALSDQEVQGIRFDYLSVCLRVRKYPESRPGFEAQERNGVRSRAWGTEYEGTCISIRSVSAVKNGHGTVLEKSVLAGLRSYIPHLVQWGASDSATLTSDVALSFDLLNEPCLCYSIAAIADKSFDPNLWPSRRLSTEVLYLESMGVRYELAALPRAASGGDDTKKDAEEGDDENMEEDDEEEDKEEPPLLLRWSRVKPDTLNKLRIASIGRTRRKKRGKGANSTPVPLAEADVDVLATAVKWTDLQWNPDGVTVNGVHYSLSKLVFKAISKARTEPAKPGK